MVLKQWSVKAVNLSCCFSKKSFPGLAGCAVSLKNHLTEFISQKFCICWLCLVHDRTHRLGWLWLRSRMTDALYVIWSSFFMQDKAVTTNFKSSVITTGCHLGTWCNLIKYSSVVDPPKNNILLHESPLLQDWEQRYKQGWHM
jgi:hypothetical protein